MRTGQLVPLFTSLTEVLPACIVDVRHHHFRSTPVTGPEQEKVPLIPQLFAGSM